MSERYMRQNYDVIDIDDGGRQMWVGEIVAALNAGDAAQKRRSAKNAEIERLKEELGQLRLELATRSLNCSKACEAKDAEIARLSGLIAEQARITKVWKEYHDIAQRQAKEALQRLYKQEAEIARLNEELEHERAIDVERRQAERAAEPPKPLLTDTDRTAIEEQAKWGEPSLVISLCRAILDIQRKVGD